MDEVSIVLIFTNLIRLIINDVFIEQVAHISKFGLEMGGCIRLCKSPHWIFFGSMMTNLSIIFQSIIR
jgi:hypothetical protein